MYFRPVPARTLLVASVMAIAPAVWAQEAPAEVQAGPEGEGIALEWQTEGVGQLGDRAEIAVAPGLRFLDGANASQLIVAAGNLSDNDELGLIGNEALDWFAVFFFDDIGYVEDDDKDALDAEKMGESFEESIAASNEVRRERGLEELAFGGWAIPPRYNEQTHQLEWATRLRSSSGESINFNTKVLGRKGVMRVILVTGPDELEETLPIFREAMAGFQFSDGQRYAQFQDGDKIAEYGLAALVVGGAGALAAKAGLFAWLLAFMKKGWKLVVAGGVAVAAVFKKFFGGKDDDDSRPAPIA